MQYCNFTPLTDLSFTLSLSLSLSISISLSLYLFVLLALNTVFFLTDGSGPVQLWTASKPVQDCNKQYGFTHYSMILNEEDESECFSFLPLSVLFGHTH